MSWSTIWELVKINVLYSNPQGMTALKKKQAKHSKKDFKAYKEMIKSQLMLTLLFLVIYLFMFIGIDFNQNPGIFSFYIALFFVMGTISAFTTLYTIFYESNDVKLYVHLPIKPTELYIAKILSSLGIGSLFLMPLLSLLVIAYWQILGHFLAIPLAIVIFLLLLLSSNVLAIYLNAIIGKLILASPHRKLVSSLMMFFSSIGSIGLILYLNATNNTRMSQDGHIQDRGQVPYFKGFYHVIKDPFSLDSLVHFIIPMLIIILMIYGIIKQVMPKYYDDILYTELKVTRKKRQTDGSKDPEKSLEQLLRKHHLFTIQNASLLTSTFLTPLIFFVSMFFPVYNARGFIANFLGSDYFGITFLIGMILGSMSTLPTSIIGVAISLEKENLYFFKSLPISFEKFLKDKFLLLMTIQILLPLLIYSILALFVLKLSLLLLTALIVGFLSTAFIQGQLMYKKDCHYLNLNWQDVSQLFTRGGNQWFAMFVMFVGMMVGGAVIALTIFLSMRTQNPFAINFALTFLLIVILALIQVYLQKSFWKKLNRFFEF
ncbi:ABC transporter permease [Streptococcus uberis]|uniref:ABC transporter permease n=1 Tax=Streptococcus uberis TaxID=1349 RepID=UPI001FF5699C|nr:ABC transporter permease [Streptococcus uberis]MCK1213604.1 ABC transporter permease [Streptococcus uberis]